MWRALLLLPAALLGSVWLWIGLPFGVTLHLEPRAQGPAPSPVTRQVVHLQAATGAQQVRLPGLLVVGQPTVLRGTVGQAFQAPSLALGDAGRFDRYGLLATVAGSQVCLTVTPLHPELRVTALGGSLDEAGRLDLTVESGAGARGCERDQRPGPVVSVQP